MPKTNRALEFHDSRVSEISRHSDAIVIKFQNAYIHSSYGEPGITDGQGWSQEIEITLSHARILNHPEIIPAQLADGRISIDQQSFENLIPLPIQRSGLVLMELITEHSEVLRVQSASIESREIGAACFVEDYKA